MSSISIDDRLFQQAIAVASAQGKSVDAFADEVLRQAIDRANLQITSRNGLPMVLVNGAAQNIDPNRVNELIQEDGF